MATRKNKSLMRNLGEFFGHVLKGIRTDPAKKTVVVNKNVQEEDLGAMTLRRTTIEEIEINSPKETKADS